MAKNVLIVDDSATMRKIIMRSIRQAGIETVDFHEAANGSQALAAVEATAFDLVLSDVDMPNMSGLEFVKALAAKFETPPPIVMITTTGSEEVLDQALQHGAVDYLRKPFTTEQIQRVLGSLLQ
jgi:two-component system chemotaxis response regulator CheY